MITFDYAAVMGIIKLTNMTKFKSGSGLFFRSSIIELSIAETSQDLTYVGLKDFLGHDFVDKNNVRFECKGMNGLFQKNTSKKTKSIILKNHRGNVNESFPEKKFDYMILIDQTLGSFGIVTFENALKNYDPEKNKNKGNLKIQIDKNDVTYLAQNVLPIDKLSSIELYNIIMKKHFMIEYDGINW